MIIDLRSLSREETPFHGDVPASILGLESAPDVRADAPIRYRLTACLIGRELIVHGRLDTEVSLQCSRCTEFFPLALKGVTLDYAAEMNAAAESVDLTDEMRETILLAFPSFPVCSESCRGLCAQCGANLNQESCACRPPTESRWDALSGLKLS
jgi:uncharacterized protein